MTQESSQNQTERIDPKALLTETDKTYDLIARKLGVKQSIWHHLDLFSDELKNVLKFVWPEMVFLPFYAWPAFFRRYLRLPDDAFTLDDDDSRIAVYALSCLAPWRATQDIIRFDPDLEKELLGMELEGKLPSDILQRLPAWCVYVDSPIQLNGADTDGFFAHLDMINHDPYLILTFQARNSLVCENEEREEKKITEACRVSLKLGDLTLKESVATANSELPEPLRNPVSHEDRGLTQAMNLLIYLCSHGFGNSQKMTVKSPYKRVKTKGVWRIFPPAKPTVRIMAQ